MRFIHPAAICGLLLNAGLLFLLFNTLNTLDMTQFNEQEQEVLQETASLQEVSFAAEVAGNRRNSGFMLA